MASNPQYADSTAYAGKFRQLHSRALASVRAKVQQVLRHGRGAVHAAIQEAKAGGRRAAGRERRHAQGARQQRRHALRGHAARRLGAVRAGGVLQRPRQRRPGGGRGDGAAVRALPRRGRARAQGCVLLPDSCLNPCTYGELDRGAAIAPGLLAGVAARAARAEYGVLLADCVRAYHDVRLGLVRDITAQRIASYAHEPLPSLTRSGCSYLMQARFWCVRYLPVLSSTWA